MDEQPRRIEEGATGFLCVSTRLEHLTVVTYAVEPERLRRHIPQPFELELVELEDGTRAALVSAVTFLNRDFHLVRVPTPRLTLGQTNYRAYVRHKGAPAVWFLGTAIDTRAVFIPRHVWQMPWRRGRYTFDVEREGARGTYGRFEVSARGEWDLHLAIEDSGKEVGVLPGFTSSVQVLNVLTQTHVGFFSRWRSSGGVGRYTIWHDLYQPRSASILEARFGLLAGLDIVPEEEQQTPHSVILEPSVLYHIHLPPRRFTEL